MTSTWARAAALVAALGVASAAAQPGCPPDVPAPTQDQLQAAARTARDHGALWRLQRNGSTSYLFATIHVGKLEWVMPGPQVRAALAETDTMALELDPSDPQVMARLSDASRSSDAPALPAALAERLARQMAAACVPELARPLLEALHPVMKAVTLSILEARWEGLDAAYGLEMALAGFAHASQRRIVSLETPESQLAALMPVGADETRQMIVASLDQIDQGSARRAAGRLAAAWARGDMRELEHYERWCECALDDADRRMQARLLDERNPLLAERIEALHRQGRKVFAAVGALHMVGHAGLPALLRARGFAVERIAFQ